MTEHTAHFDPANLSLSGYLSFKTVESLHQPMLEAIQGGPSKTIDLAEVNYADSAGLALLVDLMKVAREGNTQVQFINLPQQLRKVAEVSGLLELLPIGNT